MCVVVMAMVGCVGAGMEVMDDRHAGKSMLGEFPQCEVKTPTTTDRTAIHVRNSGSGRAGIGLSS